MPHVRFPNCLFLPCLGLAILSCSETSKETPAVTNVTNVTNNYYELAAAEEEEEEEKEENSKPPKPARPNKKHNSHAQGSGWDVATRPQHVMLRRLHDYHQSDKEVPERPCNTEKDIENHEKCMNICRNAKQVVCAGIEELVCAAPCEWVCGKLKACAGGLGNRIRHN